MDVNEITDNRFYCSTCKKETVGKLYYNVTLICRENPYANKMITLHISSYDDAGESFFGSAPVDLYRNSSEFQKMGELYKKLTDKDCYVSVIVEAIPTGNGDSDRVYRIIGSYQNNLVKSL